MYLLCERNENNDLQTGTRANIYGFPDLYIVRTELKHVCTCAVQISLTSFLWGLSHSSLGFKIGINLAGFWDVMFVLITYYWLFMRAKQICLCLHPSLADMEQAWLHWSASRCSAALTKQMFSSELKAPSISQIDCKWHLTKWLIRAVVSSLPCRHYPIRQMLPGQEETKLEGKDQEHSPPPLNEMN